MIVELEKMLHFLFWKELKAILIQEDRISFQPPDDAWRNKVTGKALNIYLVDLRENRKLRSNAKVRAGVDENRHVIYQNAPTRVDCHYLITAWSSSKGEATTPTLEEHDLLYRVMAILNNQPLNPAQIYAEDKTTLQRLPELFKTDLPAQVLPVEGFIKQAEFWGTMGTNHRWRPAIYLIVTIPLLYELPPAGPEVTTLITNIGRKRDNQRALEGEPDVLYQIGGYVIHITNNEREPVEAWVQLLDAGGALVGTVKTGKDGRFTFESLAAGNYQLSYRAQGFPDPAPRPIMIPSPSGEYDLEFI